MTILNSLFTEEIVGTKVLVSFDYDNQNFKVTDSKTKDILIEGSDITVNAFLEKNGARVFLPRYMANDPVTLVNSNNADKTHYSSWAVLMYLRNRADGVPIEMVIYPRDYQEGSKFVPGIKIPLGECVVDDINKASIVNLLMTQKELLKNLSKIAIRTYKESDNREVALVASTNKYYPMNINPEDVDSFADSLILVISSSGKNIDEEKIKKALHLDNTLSVVSSSEEEQDSLEESMKFDDIINKHVVVFESKDLNSLSRTLFHVHPEASYHGWKVSEIKENSNHNGFLFEVFGDATDKVLSDDFILGRLLSENVYITRRTPMHESSKAEKAIFSLMHGASMSDIKRMIINEGVPKEKEFEECGVTSAGMGLDAGIPLQIMDTGVTTIADTSPSSVTSSDFHGIQGKVLYPMIPEKKHKKKKKDKEIRSVLENEEILKELGISNTFSKLIALVEDDDEFNINSAENMESSEVSSDEFDSNLFNDSNSDSDLNVGGDYISNSTVSDTSSDPENKENSEEVGVVDRISRNGKLIINWEDGSVSEEDTDNVILTTSKKPEIAI